MQALSGGGCWSCPVDVDARLWCCPLGGALSPEVKRVLHEGRERVAAGYGPGTALRGVTKRLGIKPCSGCFRRAAALNQLGWPVVIGFTVVVLAVGVALSRWLLF